MLNNVTLSRNNFEHFPTGPPKQLAAVQVGLSLNLYCLLVFTICFKGFYLSLFCTNEKNCSLTIVNYTKGVCLRLSDKKGKREDLKNCPLTRPTFQLISYLKVLWVLMCFL